MDLFVTILLVWATWEKLNAQLLLLRAQMINPNVQAPQLRVAMVVTKAPSEPWSMLQTTLQAMLHQDYLYPYDVSAGADIRCSRRGLECLSRRCRASNLTASTQQPRYFDACFHRMICIVHVISK
jgi:hypothetical protein